MDTDKAEEIKLKNNFRKSVLERSKGFQKYFKEMERNKGDYPELS